VPSFARQTSFAGSHPAIQKDYSYSMILIAMEDKMAPAAGLIRVAHPAGMTFVMSLTLRSSNQLRWFSSSYPKRLQL